MEVVIMVVENESSSDVTGWTLESEEDYRGRTGVRDDEVVLAAPGVAVRPPWPRADRWGLVVTEFDPGPADGPGPVRFLGKWRTSPQPPKTLMPGPVVVVLIAPGGAALESETVDVRVVVATPTGWRMCQAFWGLGRSWPSTVATAAQAALATDPNYPAVMAESEFRAGRTTLRADEVILAASGVGVRPPMRTPSWAHCLELVALEFAGPSDEASGPIPWLLSAVWRRSARRLVPGRLHEVLIMVEEAEPVGGAARVTVRLLHGETGVWRMVGHWPSLGERWPLVITPTVRLLKSAHGHIFTHSVPLVMPTA